MVLLPHLHSSHNESARRQNWRIKHCHKDETHIHQPTGSETTGRAYTTYIHTKKTQVARAWPSIACSKSSPSLTWATSPPSAPPLMSIGVKIHQVRPFTRFSSSSSAPPALCCYAPHENGRVARDGQGTKYFTQLSLRNGTAVKRLAASDAAACGGKVRTKPRQQGCGYGNTPFLCRVFYLWPGRCLPVCCVGPHAACMHNKLLQAERSAPATAVVHHAALLITVSEAPPPV